jgi:hypothetical protein
MKHGAQLSISMVTPVFAVRILFKCRKTILDLKTEYERGENVITDWML